MAAGEGETPRRGARDGAGAAPERPPGGGTGERMAGASKGPPAGRRQGVEGSAAGGPAGRAAACPSCRGARPAGRGAAGSARDLHAGRYTDALRLMVDGTLTADAAAYRAAAATFEDLAGAGVVPGGDEFYATAYSALCYDVAGMRQDAARMYGLLGSRYSGEFEYIVGSAGHARRLAEGLAALGMGDGGARLAPALDDARGWLRSRAGPGGSIGHDTPDDYNLFFALLNLLCRFFKAIGGPDPDGRARDLAEKAGGFYDDLVRYFPDPPLGLMVSLYLRLVEAEYGRSASGAGPVGGAAAGPPCLARLGDGRALRARHSGND